MIELIVFDMAGTVVDEDNAVYKILHQAVRDAGYEVEWEKTLLYAAGKEKFQAIKDVLKEFSGKEVEESIAKSIFETFKGQLESGYRNNPVKEQNGAADTFTWLKEQGIKVALNTGYSRNITDILLSQIPEWNGLYDASITSDDVVNGRPQPDMILKAMELTGVNNPEKVAKVGDSIIDIEEGKSANCGLTFGITTGAHTREQLASAEPSFIIDSLEEIKELTTS